MHPQPNAVPSSAVWPGHKRQNGRARITNDAGFLPKRTPSLFAQARRRRDLVEAFTAALGGEDAMSPVVLMHVRRAAELVTAAEMVRADMLNGQPVDLLALARLEGHAARAVRVLGVKIEKPAPALRRARERWNAQQAQKTKTAKAVRREAAKPQPRRREPPGHDEAETTA